MIVAFFNKYKQTILYSCILAALLFFLKWLELKYIIVDYSLEIYSGAIASLFTGLGIWLAISLMKPKTKTVFVEKEIWLSKSDEFTQDIAAIEQLGLSKREMEVLQLMAEGKSNQEIATHLFVSLATIKTHISKLFDKLEVKRRTQAIEKAKRLCLIP